MKSKPFAYWRRLYEALVEAGEPQLTWNEAYDFYSAGLNREDALVRSCSAPNNPRLTISTKLSIKLWACLIKYFYSPETARSPEQATPKQPDNVQMVVCAGQKLFSILN